MWHDIGSCLYSPQSSGRINALGTLASLPAGDVFRARLILALAHGMSYAEIKQRLPHDGPDHLALEAAV